MSRAICYSRRGRVAFSHRPFASAPATPGNSGDGGVALYVSSGPDDETPPEIVYRRSHSVDTSGPHRIGKLTTGRKTSAVSFATEPSTALEYELDPSKAYRIGLRAWRDDVENPQVFGEQILIVDADGNSAPIIEGGGYVLTVQKRQAAGMRVTAVWESPAAAAPETITLVRVSGPTAVADQSLQFSASQRQYVFTVTGLQDGGSYVFRVVATRGLYTIRAKRAFGSELTDFTFVADGSGPSAVTGLRIRAI